VKAMRKPLKRQRTIGSIDIGKVEFDRNCRHEIIPILIGLQWIYGRSGVLRKVLDLIEKDIARGKSTRCGAPGLDYWEILVLAAVRHGCNLDYDALQDLANNHTKIRQMLGLGQMDTRRYSRSTLQENIAKIGPKTIEEISQLVIDEGHVLCPKVIERVRGDSFVTKTNIHHPTDASLITDGVRKMLDFVIELATLLSIVGWRRSGHLWAQVRKVHRRIQRTAASKKTDREKRLQELYLELITSAQHIAKRCEETISTAQQVMKKDDIGALVINSLIKELKNYIEFTRKGCDLAHRRVVLEEKIPHEEKIFSLFEPHTELINRGKTPYPIEFGHRVLIIQDKAGFIIKFYVMDHTTDEKVLVPIMEKLQCRYGGKIMSASFDKGFYTPQNLIALRKMIPLVCIPKKGKLGEEDKKREGSLRFGKARKWHPGIESAIHALGSGNGLALCKDKKEEGYHRYVALGVLGRNLQVLGCILLKKAKRKQRQQAKAA
jgi:IS5 family transposase